MRPFLDICQDFLKVSDLATPFLNYDGVEPAINLQKDSHINHLGDLRRELEKLIDFDRNAASEARYQEMRKKIDAHFDSITPEELADQLRKCGVIFEGDIKDNWEI